VGNNGGKTQAVEKKPANCKGKKIYTGDVIAFPRHIRTFFLHDASAAFDYILK
jgi:hypothetical protein